MSAAEINDARCPDYNAPTIWEQTDGAWKPMRCDACEALHDESGIPGGEHDRKAHRMTPDDYPDRHADGPHEDPLHDDGPRSSADEAEGYHDLALGSVEVFWGPNYNHPPGWYWWSCSPGCLPDGDGTPSASFGRSSEALEDAKTDEDHDEPAPPGRRVYLDSVATRCLRVLDAADLNPFSFDAKALDAPDDLDTDPDTDADAIADEDDESFARSVFSGSGLMGGCYMPAVTYHSARRIRQFVTLLLSSFYERRADWGEDLPGPEHAEHTDPESLDVWWCCWAIESVAWAVMDAMEDDQ